MFASEPFVRILPPKPFQPQAPVGLENALLTVAAAGPFLEELEPAVLSLEESIGRIANLADEIEATYTPEFFQGQADLAAQRLVREARGLILPGTLCPAALLVLFFVLLWLDSESSVRKSGRHEMPKPLMRKPKRRLSAKNDPEEPMVRGDYPNSRWHHRFRPTLSCLFIFNYRFDHSATLGIRL